ncbi:MAG: integration host factor subunit beta [Candidatus Glassbacteria bacterium]|nr:integration host factor subunit beta [Candidatus Glassbacteria bacterium]
MNKAQLVEKVAGSTKLSKQATKKVLDELLEVIGKSLSAGTSIELRGFGSFKVKQRKERMARNPRTGEQVKVPSRSVPTFKPSRSFGVKAAKRK